MVTNLLASSKRWIVSLVTANLLGIAIAANSALADDPPGHTQEVRSKSAGHSSDQSGSPKARALKRMRHPDGSGNFVSGVGSSGPATPARAIAWRRRRCA
jgi:hypothetical protein